jgi:hypothetical protein
MTYMTIAKNNVRRFIIATSALGVVSVISLTSAGCAAGVAHSQSSAPAANCQGPGAITASSCLVPTGSWLYTVTIPGSPAFQGVESYGDGGDYSEADELSILPGYLATAGHGAWSATAATGGFLLTYQNLTYDSNQNPTGYSRVRQTTTIDSTGTTYTGSGDFTYYDTKGAAIPGGSGTFTIAATKILVSQPGS